MSRKTQAGSTRIIVLLAIVLVGTGVGFFLISKGIIKNPLQALRNQSLGGQIFNKVQNPISGKIPETSPLGTVKINPFKNIYPNPFDKISK